MKNAQQGFGTVTVLAAVAALFIIGLSGYIIYDKNRNSDSTRNAQTEATGSQSGQQTASKTTGVYTSRSGISFVKPENWKVVEGEDGEVSLTSPDYEKTEKFEEGVQTYHKGGLIVISSEYDPQFPGIEKYLQEGRFNHETELKDTEGVTVSGRTAAKFTWNSVGPSERVVLFHDQETSYRIRYVDPGTDDYEKYLPVFDVLVSGVKTSF